MSVRDVVNSLLKLQLTTGSSTPPSITGVSLSTNTKCSQYHTVYIWFWLSVLVFVVAVIIGVLQGSKHYRIYSLQVRIMYLSDTSLSRLLQHREG